MSNDEVQDIIEQLKRLQLKQTELITRLERLNEAKASVRKENPDKAAFAAAARKFAIGDRVRIRNPGPFQSNTGTIVKIGRSRNTVQTRSGERVIRAPKNLSFEE
jgi:transcription antitermination factor NusG